MTSSALELSVLKLASSRRRLGQSARFSFDNDLAQSLGTGNDSMSPMKKAKEIPPPWFADEDLFTIEQHRAALPFKWKAIPETCRDQELDAGESQAFKDSLSDSDQESSSASSPAFTLSPSSSTNSTSRTSSTRSSVSSLDEPLAIVQATPKFQMKPLPVLWATTTKKDSGCVQTLSHSSKQPGIVPNASKGHALALKPPPGMQSMKQFMTLDCENRSINSYSFSSRCVNSLINSTALNSSSIVSLKSDQRRSFRRDGLKALPFLTSPKKHVEVILTPTTPTPLLGFEDWPKVVQQQEEQEKQQQQKQRQQKQRQEKKQQEQQQKQQQQLQQTARITGPHHRAVSMPPMQTVFMKLSTADCQDTDIIFNEDVGKKGGLRERRAVSSVSSRTLANGFTPKTRSWVFDEDADYSDSESDEESDTVDSTEPFDGEDGKKKEEVHRNAKNCAARGVSALEALKEKSEKEKDKRKRDALSRLKRIFKSSGSSSSGSSSSSSSGSNSGRKGEQQSKLQLKPARLSSVSPAPPPPLALPQGDPRLKKSSQHNKQVTKAVSSPLLKLCLSNPIAKALIRNVRQLRSFEFHYHRPSHRPRAITAK